MSDYIKSKYRYGLKFLKVLPNINNNCIYNLNFINKIKNKKLNL